MSTGMLVSAVLSLTTALISGIVLFVVQRGQKRSDEMEADRAKRETLILESLDAVFAVTKELVECALNGKAPNGELHEAYEYKQQAKHKLEAYEREQAAKK